MGFVNVARGVRAIGYIERDPLPGGPVALVTHSGSVFSAMLRTRRHLGFTLVVSAGQELVTATASYVDYALDLEGTRVDRAGARDAPPARRAAGGPPARRRTRTSPSWP